MDWSFEVIVLHVHLWQEEDQFWFVERVVLGELSIIRTHLTRRQELLIALGDSQESELVRCGLDVIFKSYVARINAKSFPRY